MPDTYVLLAMTFIACLSLRTGYEGLKEAGKIDPENKLVFAGIFAVMCALWVSWFVLCPLDPYAADLPSWVSLGGRAVFLTGMILAVGALLQLRALENVKHLVTNKFFSRLRHPMYTGFILWIIGWSLYYGAMLSLLVGCLGIVNILYWRRLEDARLLVQHGEAYREYSKKTWF
jgi:protein-S-isoprenylcysteine O-methyltransferase Ste14